MDIIRDYLYNWHEELYTEHFTNQDCLECFEGITYMPVSEISAYHLQSRRWAEDYTKAYNAYKEVRHGKNNRNSNR